MLSERADCIIQARMNSARLPGKVMARLGGKPILEHILTRLKHCPLINRIVVATTTSPQDRVLVRWASQASIPCWQGPEQDVLTRICQAIAILDSQTIVHVTADNPLIDPRTITMTWQGAKDTDFDLACMPKLPLGLGADIFSKKALQRADQLATSVQHREHINSFFFDHPELFKIVCLSPPDDMQAPGLRLTVDTAEDLALVQKVYNRFHRPGEIINTHEIIALYRRDQAFFQDNAHIKQHYVSTRLKELREDERVRPETWEKSR